MPSFFVCLVTLQLVPVEKRDLWKFMSKSLVGDRQCWTSAYPSSQGAGIVAGTYEDYVVDDHLAAGQSNAIL
jgi:hypothetical protein